MQALLLIDIQEGLDESEFWGGSRNNISAEDNCRKILDFFRQHNLPLFHIQHSSTNPQSPLYPGKKSQRIKSIVSPKDDEIVIVKSTNSAFVNTELEKLLKEKDIDELVVVGLTTDHCVSTTVRNGADLGYKVVLISDATATYAKTGIDGKVYPAELIHTTAIASLQGEFATISNTKHLLSELHSQIFNPDNNNHP